MDTHINLPPLKYQFIHKPLVIGGKAMEYYGLRQSGNDVDLVVSPEDFEALWSLYLLNHRDIYGDKGVTIENFEIWKTIRWFDYTFLSEKAVEKDHYLVVSIYQLLFMKVLSMEVKEKYAHDVILIRDHINKNNALYARGIT